jgi:hypothetical protein
MRFPQQHALRTRCNCLLLLITLASSDCSRPASHTTSPLKLVSKESTETTTRLSSSPSSGHAPITGEAEDGRHVHPLPSKGDNRKKNSSMKVVALLFFKLFFLKKCLRERGCACCSCSRLFVICVGSADAGVVYCIIISRRNKRAVPCTRVSLRVIIPRYAHKDTCILYTCRTITLTRDSRCSSTRPRGTRQPQEHASLV